MDIQNKDKSLLFKFMPINLNLIRLLVNSEIWFSSLPKLNDPFEIEFELERMNELPKDEFLIDWYQNLSSFKYDSNKINRLLDRLKKDPSQFYKDLKTDVRVKYHSKLKIACFSLIYNEILLWSHYADDHRGVSLVFSKDTLVDSVGQENNHFDMDFIEARNVRYRQSKKLNVIFNEAEYTLPIRNLQSSIFGKLTCWKYEKEFRILCKNTFTKTQEGYGSKFSKDSLKGVIFGERCSTTDVALVYSLINKFEYVDANFFLGVSKIVPSTGKLTSIQLVGQISFDELNLNRIEWLYRTH